MECYPVSSQSNKTLHLVCTELDIVVSVWESVIAMSLNVNDGVCLICLAKYIVLCLQNTKYIALNCMCPLWFFAQDCFLHHKYSQLSISQVEIYSKLLISQSKFSGPQKFTWRYW